MNCKQNENIAGDQTAERKYQLTLLIEPCVVKLPYGKFASCLQALFPAIVYWSG
ncbi:hypothetical protein [Bacillus haynesii]|uniref:hypothetical protein n=1 Tax=Bacillus haynesii TaxID=1925021 RepID=UPI00228054B5|nr:hypothetical protein [Bacillus haynesii]MCY7992061.1 hypothetical protein [Bacillus haynesii]